MVDWTRYESIIKTTGETQRERELYKAKQFILRNGRANPSFKKVHINDDPEERWLAINSGTQTYYKKIHTLPGEIIYPGDMVTWSNSKWLVTTADSDQEFIVDGTMQQCNRVLKWQNENGDIIERDVVCLSATAYNSGVEDTQLLTIGYDQILIYIAYDPETVLLDRDMRFFISNNYKKPRPYKLTSINTTTEIYNGHGYLRIIVTEDQIEKDDNLDLLICNYKEKNTDDSPTLNKISKIDYTSKTIKSGYKRGTTFTANFYDNDVLQDVPPVWDVDTNAESLVVSYDGNNITLSIDDDNYIGYTVKLTLKDESNEYQEDSIMLDITGLF